MSEFRLIILGKSAQKVVLLYLKSTVFIGDVCSMTVLYSISPPWWWWTNPCNLLAQTISVFPEASFEESGMKVAWGRLLFPIRFYLYHNAWRLTVTFYRLNFRVNGAHGNGDSLKPTWSRTLPLKVKRKRVVFCDVTNLCKIMSPNNIFLLSGTC